RPVLPTVWQERSTSLGRRTALTLSGFDGGLGLRRSPLAGRRFTTRSRRDQPLIERGLPHADVQCRRTPRCRGGFSSFHTFIRPSPAPAAFVGNRCLAISAIGDTR